MFAIEAIDYGKSEEESKTKSVKLHSFLKRCMDLFLLYNPPSL